MPNRLMVDSIVSVGAVDAGDNPEARMMFWKRGKSKSDPLEGLDEEREGMAEFSLSDLPLDDEQRTALDEHIAAEVAKALEAVGPVEVDEEPVEDDVLKSAPDEIQALVEELRKSADENARALAEEVAKREAAEYLAKAEPLTALIGDPTETAPVLQALHAAAPEEAKTVMGWLEALASREDLAKLFASFGAADSGDPLAGKDEWVRKYREEHGVSDAEARAAFWKQHPEAVDAARERE